MNNEITLTQTDLIFDYKAKIPNELQYHIAQVAIKSSTKLTDKKIKWVVEVMIESAIYTHLGFGGSSLRGDELMKSFKQLKEENIEYTIYALNCSRALNIHFPSSFSFSF